MSVGACHAVDPERVRHAGRDYANGARVQLEAVRAGVYGELPVEHDVALVLRVGVERRRCVARKEELDHGEAAIDGLSRHPDNRQSAEEPEPLVLTCRRPRHGQLSSGECR